MQNSILLENISPDELFSKIRELVSEELAKRLQPETPQVYNTKKETAAKLRITIPTLNKLTSDGTLNGYRIGKRILFKADEVNEALKVIHTIKYKRG